MASPASERFLVTGAFGCIGTWVVRQLVAEGTPVTALDIGADPHRWRLVMSDSEIRQVRRVHADIADLAALERVLDEDGIDRVIHLAALQVPFCRADPPLGARVNVLGTVNVFEAAKRRAGRIDHVVYASSIAAYDALDSGGGGIEMTGLPGTLYGVYKRANEGTAHLYWMDEGVASIGLRPHTVFGPGRDQGLTSAPTVAMLAAAARMPYRVPFGGRSQLQYAPDVAGAFIAAARAHGGRRHRPQPGRKHGPHARRGQVDRRRRPRLGRPDQLRRGAAAVPRGGRRALARGADRAHRRDAVRCRGGRDGRPVPHAARRRHDRRVPPRRRRRGGGRPGRVTAVADALRAAVGPDVVVRAPTAADLSDATEARGLRGAADAVAEPRTTAQVAAIVRFCDAHDVPIVPRGGGTGFAGGAVPTTGGVVVSLARMTSVRTFDPLQWRIHAEAGLRTADLRRIVRESGLWFPPDPGAAESSQIGGNIATNAGGPHAFKYGVTGAWVTGLEAVVPPGDVIRLGGPARKDVAGYDLMRLLIGSEGTLGIVTAAWLRLIPAVESSLPVIGLYPTVAAGCAAIEAAMASGIVPAAIEYLDAATMGYAAAGFPVPLAEAAFAVVAEADGSRPEALAGREALCEALADGATAVHSPEAPAEVAALWRWRDGVSLAVTAVRGGKVSEDVVVPVDRLAEAIAETVAIGARHGLEALSWGHAGDGNMHSSFLLDRADRGAVERAEEAAQELFAMAVALGGSVSGEHGIGVVKGGQLRRQWDARAVELHRATKRMFDPKGLLNPGKKLA